MQRKIWLPILAVLTIALSVVFLIRSSSREAPHEFTKAEEKVMRTPLGVIPMPAEAARAMQKANQQRK